MTFREIRQKVIDSGGVKSFKMSTLRDANGSKRLSDGICSEISKSLADSGIAYQGQSLPTNQEQYVRLYLKDSSIADLIDAVANPSPSNDKTLRDAVENVEIVAQIRELVCDD